MAVKNIFAFPPLKKLYIIHIIYLYVGYYYVGYYGGFMRGDWGAVFIQTDLRKICKNADVVVRSIKNAFPSETNESLARKAGVSFQTIQRWVGSGRADAEAMQRLLAAFPSKRTKNERVYLDKASPKQLYDRCAAIGWDNVIQAGKVEES